MDPEKICMQMTLAAREAAEYIRKESQSFSKDKVETKSKNDFVSYVDLNTEKMLVDKLSHIIPEAGFITEEGTTADNKGKLVWIIDPLDGTTNFIHGLPPFSVSIALAEDEEIIAGVVYNIYSDEMFHAYKNGGAWLNMKQIRVSDTSDIKDSLAATGFPYKDYSRLDNYLICLEYFMRNTRGVRRLGSAAVDLAYVACGRFDMYFEYSINIWDIAAGAILIKEAGGKISDFSGNEKNLSGNEVIASNSLIYDEFRGIVDNMMKK